MDAGDVVTGRLREAPPEDAEDLETESFVAHPDTAMDVDGDLGSIL
jgi:hypothetical protein